MTYRIRTLSPERARDFASLTFPAYRSRIGRDTAAVGLMSDNEPVGLALTSLPDCKGSAELLSLFVAFPHRKRGMGTLLLGRTQKLLARVGVRSLRTSWSETLPGALPFQAVLARQEWSAPHKRMLVLKGDFSREMGTLIHADYPAYRTAPRLPRKYSISPWQDMSAKDRKFILSRQGLPDWYGPEANPFRQENLMEPLTSLILRYKGGIAGWITTHRTGPDTIRYTDIFIRQDLKRTGAVSIATLLHAFWLQYDQGPPRFTMAVDRNNRSLTRLILERSGQALHPSWTWGAGKWIGNTAPG
jgi:hypothetical protein